MLETTLCYYHIDPLSMRKREYELCRMEKAKGEEEDKGEREGEGDREGVMEREQARERESARTGGGESK